MKKTSIFFLSIATLIICFSLQITVSASPTLANTGIPYQTYTLGEYGRTVPTQTAYIPSGVYGSNLNLSNPQDLFYYNQQFYLADTNNKRIVVLDYQGELVKIYENSEFNTPMGVFVKEEYLYVADKGAQQVFKINLNTEEIVQRIVKPTSPIFGQKNNFLPTKIVVGSNDSIYIVGEGSTSGIIQMNYAGEFVGYLGINTVSFSFRKLLYNLFVKDSNLAASLPPAPTNISLGEKGSILTTNINVNETFKRLNISGINTLLPSTVYPSAPLADIWMGDYNYIYLVASTGEVYEYDNNGNLLFHFNTKDAAMSQTLGLTSSPTGIVSDHMGNIYILDKVYNNIQVYQKTAFVDILHQALTLYNNGRYLESKSLWEEILRQNSSFALAHSALGAALTKEGKYEEALMQFYDAKDQSGYSNAYWEIRNVAIQNKLSIWVVIIIGVLVIGKILLNWFRGSTIYHNLQKKKFFEKHKLLNDLKLSFKMLKKPNDVIYYVKRKHQGSYLSAGIVFLSFIIVYLINLYGTGFLFKNPNPNSVFVQLLITCGIFFIYVIINYLVSAFFDGEGRFIDVVIISCYALIPYIVLTLPMTVLSHALTYNESFIYNFYNQIVIGWTIILLIISVKEVHNYTLWESVKSILLIIFGVFVVLLMGLLIYSFLGQLIDFITSIIKEVAYRV